MSQINFCEFTAFDLDKNMQVTETEIDRLIQVTGLMELDSIFENLDINKGINVFYDHTQSLNALSKAQLVVCFYSNHLIYLYFFFR